MSPCVLRTVRLAGAIVAALALLGLPASCGSVGRDDALPVRPCGAAGPWRTVGAVNVCLGDALAVPSSLDPGQVGGFCATGDAKACTSDADCRPAERCRCGLCRVVRCRRSNECRAGETCVAALGRCARACDPGDPASCPGGWSCSMGGCVADCGGDGDCAHGETCNARNGRCLAVVCAADADCAAGYRCDVQTTRADVAGPDLVARDDGPWVVAEVRAAGRSTIRSFVWPAEGRIDADAAAPLLEPSLPWEGDRVGAPDVVVADGATRLFYAGGDDAGIGLAVADGGVFRRAGDGPILAPLEPWEAGRVGGPAAWSDGDGGIVLLYAGGDGAGLGAARSGADGSYARISAAPVLAPSGMAVPGRWDELDRLADPAAAGATGEGAIRVFVAARGVLLSGADAGTGGPPDWSIGMALARVSADGVAMVADPYGPVLAERTGLGSANMREERDPGVLPVAGGWRMLYAEPLDGGGSGLRAAACP